MELKEFVAETITNVLEGIREAQERPGGQHVNMEGHYTAGFVKWTGGLTALGPEEVASVLSFDVVVTVTEDSNAKGKIAVLGIGAQGGISTSTVAQNRIQFAVPIMLPRPGK
jgi:hypothetical protein